MSRPLFADHDFNGRIIDGQFRREPAVGSVLLRDVLAPDTPDAQVLEYAAGAGRVVVFHDVNTMTAAARERIVEGETMAGLIVVRQSLPIGAVIADLLLLWSATEADEWRDQVLFLPI